MASRIERPGVRQAGGFALLTVIFITVCFAVLGVSAVALVTGSAQMAGDEYRSQQAFDVAEAGLSYTARQLVSDGDWSDNQPFTKAFGPGSFSVAYISQQTSSAEVEVSGTVSGITRKVRQSFTMAGTASFEDALYTTEDVLTQGSSAGVVTGPVTAGGIVDTEGGVIFDGEITENHAQAQIPTPDWSYWQLAADHVISGNYNFNSGTYNGIYYVTGNVQINANVVVNGSIISRGEIKTAGNANITVNAVAPHPSLLAEAGVTFTGTSNVVINGWVFSTGPITFTGNSDMVLTGGATAGGDITMTGNTDVVITYDPERAPSKGFDGGEPGGLRTGTWREVI
jgi:hypothetical protein